MFLNQISKSEFSPPVIQDILYHYHPVEVDLKQKVKHKIKPKKSPAYDLITPEMIKNLPNITFETSRTFF